MAKANIVQPEESKDKGGEKVSTELVQRIDTQDQTINILKTNLESLENINRFVLIVLLLGFITMFLAFISMLVSAFNSGTATQIEFIKSLQQILDALPKK